MPPLVLVATPPKSQSHTGLHQGPHVRPTEGGGGGDGASMQGGWQLHKGCACHFPTPSRAGLVTQPSLEPSSLSEPLKPPYNLQEAEVSVVDVKTCSQAYSSPNGSLIQPDMLCAQGPGDACQVSREHGRTAWPEAWRGPPSPRYPHLHSDFLSCRMTLEGH